MTAFTKFDHLLNAMESAGHQQVPADHGYSEKRRAVLQHVAELEAALSAASQDAARYRKVRLGRSWSVIDGIGNDLRAEELDAAADATIAKDAP